MDKPSSIRNVFLFILIYLIAFRLSFYPVVINGVVILFTFFFFGKVRDLGLSKTNFSWKVIPLALTLALVINLFAKTVLIPMSDFIAGTERDLTRFENLRGNPMALMNFLPYIWISAAFGEEMIFRGFILTQFPLVKLKQKISPVWGLLFSSVLFGLGHWYQGLSGMIFTGLMGLILGTIFLRTGRNLFLCMLIHGFFDTISGLMYVLRWDLFFHNLYH